MDENEDDDDGCSRVGSDTEKEEGDGLLLCLFGTGEKAVDNKNTGAARSQQTQRTTQNAPGIRNTRKE